MPDCDAQTLVSESRCLVEGMNDRQLLASILCTLATANGMECDAAALVESSKCLWMGMNERQLLAAIAFILCEGGGIPESDVEWIAWTPTTPVAAPTDSTKAVERRPLDGNPPVVWLPPAGPWQ